MDFIKNYPGFLMYFRFWGWSLFNKVFFIVVSIEDPFDQDDWPAWKSLTADVEVQIVA